MGTKQKELLGRGFTPPCVMSNNGPGSPMSSGRCQTFAWKHYEQKKDQCVELVTWVDVPCGSTIDPTKKDLSELACGEAPPGGDHCQDPCREKITADMVDINNADRMYNLFSEGGVKPMRPQILLTVLELRMVQTLLWTQACFLMPQVDTILQVALYQFLTIKSACTIRRPKIFCST